MGELLQRGVGHACHHRHAGDCAAAVLHAKSPAFLTAGGEAGTEGRPTEFQGFVGFRARDADDSCVKRVCAEQGKHSLCTFSIFLLPRQRKTNKTVVQGNQTVFQNLIADEQVEDEAGVTLGRADPNGFLAVHAALMEEKRTAAVCRAHVVFAKETEGGGVAKQTVISAHHEPIAVGQKSLPLLRRERFAGREVCFQDFVFGALRLNDVGGSRGTSRSGSVQTIHRQRAQLGAAEHVGQRKRKLFCVLIQRQRAGALHGLTGFSGDGIGDKPTSSFRIGNASIVLGGFRGDGNEESPLLIGEDLAALHGCFIAAAPPVDAANFKLHTGIQEGNTRERASLTGDANSVTGFVSLRDGMCGDGENGAFVFFHVNP